MAAAYTDFTSANPVWRIATDAWRFDGEATYDVAVDDLDARARLAYVEQLPWWKVIGARDLPSVMRAAREVRSEVVIQEPGIYRVVALPRFENGLSAGASVPTLD